MAYNSAVVDPALHVAHLLEAIEVFFCLKFQGFDCLYSAVAVVRWKKALPGYSVKQKRWICKKGDWEDITQYSYHMLYKSL